jgi:hypothetical protein
MNEKRSRKSVWLEFAAWVAVAIITAVILALVSDKILPTSF